MADNISSYSTVVSLKSKEHRDLLDIVDRLRGQGISTYVDLPQIIVCGDQSSGKSSVLEAISGLAFPTKDNLCTRFATELLLRRATTEGIKVSIIPGGERSDGEKEKLRAYDPPVKELNLGQVVEEVKDLLGLSGNVPRKVFSNDILHVELSGPTQPHLTLVDLPGLFKAGNRDQSDEDAALVRELVLSYMKKPRTIILAVVSAKSDFALQEVTKYARELDPKGARTLGLITKPDTLYHGSDSERAYVELAQNKDVTFHLGWHVLRNRDYEMRNSTSIWKTLEPSQMGIEALRPRLSRVLQGQILRHLPSVLREVETGMSECNRKLEKLGPSRKTLGQQRQYLLHVSNEFSKLAQNAVDGTYGHEFFESAQTDIGYQKRIRAVVQNTLMEFAENMRVNGHAKEIVEKASEDNDRQISRSQYVEEVKKLMMRTKGCELPCTFNPLIVEELFREQCKPWKDIVDQFVRRIVEAAYSTVRAALDFAADEATADRLFHQLNASMDQLKESLAKKAIEILNPHLSGHPITHNHYLTDNVQKAQKERSKGNIERALTSFFGYDAVPSEFIKPNFSMQRLIDTIVEADTEKDMDRYACLTAIDVMQAYYKVALKKVVDDISVLAIEKCFIQELPNLLSLQTISSLSDTVTEKIACESQESAHERAYTKKKLTILESGLDGLKDLGMYQLEGIDSAGTDEKTKGDVAV